MIQAQALCDSRKFEQGSAILSLAQVSIPKAERVLQSELEFARGECAFSTDSLRARQHYLAAAELAHGYDAQLEAKARGDAGFVLMQRRRFDEAIQDFSAALAVADSPLLRQRLLGDMGECYQLLGDFRAAEPWLKQAEAIAENIKDARNDRAKWLIDLGGQNYSQIEYVKAKANYLQALSIADELNDTDLKARCLDDLAQLALGTGDRNDAQGAIKRFEALYPQGDQYLNLMLNKATLAKFDNDLKQSQSLLQKILTTASPNPQIRWRAESDLASIYVAEGKFKEAEQSFQQAVSAVEQAFSGVTGDRARISFFDYEPFYDQYVRFLIMRNRPLDALNIAERGRSRTLADSLKLDAGKQGLDLPRIQAYLRPRRQVVLAYWLEWNSESYLWVITDSQFKLLRLPSENEIVREIDAYNHDILDRNAEDSEQGKKLYDMLVAPAQQFLRRGSNVIIVPHRRLYKLNFETLISQQGKPHYWIEDACIQNVSFLAALENPRRLHTRYSKQMLLIGAPVQASKEFPGLAHAPEELEKVSAHFAQKKETVLAGKDATPAAYQSSDPSDFRFFHFVTHGTANDLNPLDSAIILSPSGEGYKLYARDIINTKIHPELVMISTCYGAGTRQYSGEGLVGLAWAFMRAGAHQVIAALWEVDDEANAQLMDHFYDELTRTDNPAEALHAAKLAMLHSKSFRRRPYYWASLQLYTGP